jgi:hypothetical protein
MQASKATLRGRVSVPATPADPTEEVRASAAYGPLSRPPPEPPAPLDAP